MIQQKKLILAVLSILLLLSPAHAAAGFQSAHSYPVGSFPYAVTVGDFNADGIIDIATCNTGDPISGANGSVSILLGKGNGTFQAAKNFIAVKNCTDIAAGDFDSDGSSDLLVLRTGDYTVADDGDATIFLSNGDGTFRKGKTLIPGKNPADVAVTDLDADHKLDLIFPNHTDNTASVLLGNGDGNFQSAVAYKAGVAPTSVRVVDVDEDGKSDLAVFSVLAADFLLGNGDGTFRQGSSIILGIGTTTLAIADFNGDGALDLIVSSCTIFRHPNGCSTALRLGNGSGGLQSSIPLSGIAGPRAADINGDGKLDLVGRTPDGSQFALLLGNGDGTFQSSLTFAAGTNAPVAMLTDLDRDKAPDLIGLDASANSVTVLLNKGTDFSISASAPSPSNVSSGQSATSTLSLSLLNSFDNPVSLACKVQPSQGSPTCSMSTNYVTFDSSGKATATLTIAAGLGAATLMVPHRYHDNSNPFSSGWLPVAAIGFMGTGLGCGYSKRRRRLFLAGCIFAGLIFQPACGGGGNIGPKSVKYAITITGTSGSTQHSATTTLTVQ